jgi:HAD superfamily hydrolase (TIGR01509 family)
MSGVTEGARSSPHIGDFGLVIFDCDGVLVDSETISCATVASMLTRHGVACDLPAALTRFLGSPASAVIDAYARASGHPPPEDFVRQWREQLFTAFASDLAPVAGARETIETLRLPYCVASSSDGERIELALRKTSLWDLFKGRVFSTTMVAHGKPAPDLFLLAAATSGVAPARCVVVEDSVNGIIAAKAAGMTAYGFTAGSHYAVLDQTQGLLGAGADLIIGSMQELRARVAS